MTNDKAARCYCTCHYVSLGRKECSDCCHSPTPRTEKKAHECKWKPEHEEKDCPEVEFSKLNGSKPPTDSEDDAIEAIIWEFMGNFEWDKDSEVQKEKLTFIRRALRSYGDMREEKGRHDGSKDEAVYVADAFDKGKEEGRRAALDELEKRIKSMKVQYEGSSLLKKGEEKVVGYVVKCSKDCFISVIEDMRK